MAIVAILGHRANLPGQHGFAFGPGTAPRMFATLLAIVGALVALTGLFTDGPPIGHFAVRGPAYVRGGDPPVRRHDPRRSICTSSAFLFAIPPLGLVLSTFVAFMVSIMGSSEMRWVESLLAAVAMTAFCVVSVRLSAAAAVPAVALVLSRGEQ